MDSIAKARIGRTDLMVSQLGFGGVPLGGLYKDMPEDEAGATVRRALELGIQYFDTAPIYGFGKSEIRLGRELARINRDSFVVATNNGATTGTPLTGAAIIGAGGVRSGRDAVEFLRAGADPEAFLERLRLTWEAAQAQAAQPEPGTFSAGIARVLGAPWLAIAAAASKLIL